MLLLAVKLNENSIRKPRSNQFRNYMIPDKEVKFVWSLWIPKALPTLKFNHMLMSEFS